MKRNLLFVVFMTLLITLQAQVEMPVISTKMTGIADVYEFVKTIGDDGETYIDLKPSGVKINRGEIFHIYGIYSTKQDVEIGAKPSDLEQRYRNYQWVMITAGIVNDDSKFIKFILARNSFLNGEEKGLWESYLLRFDSLLDGK